LVGIAGAASALWIDAASFFISAITVGLVIPPTIAATLDAAKGSYFTELMSGLRFLVQDKLLLILAVQLALANMLGEPFFAVVFPVYANEVFHSAAKLGLMLAAFGAGELLGSVCYGWFGLRFSRRTLWIVAFLIIPFQTWLLLFRPPLVVMLILFFLPGAVTGQLNPLLVTVRLERIPAELRGRVFSTFSATSTVAAPIGMIAIGLIVERWGLNPAIFLIGLGYFIIGAVLLFLPGLKELDRPRPAIAITTTAPTSS
jgi:MFS family permease